ncbi:ras-related protein Rab-7L1 isoform X1 [Callorhinchus milii]|uniref:ras-related protein Rab-7L1 isoform X1 n=1 Tax=Callorhinchus milii TaxID=7868 RepID=UPI001C3FCF97|nr:ras-related protein Rab-7L1 isoform X1 [Callorhinchus milii]
MAKDHLFKVLVIGDSTVGKTSLVQRYAYDSFNKNYKSTVGVDFALKILEWSDTETVRLQLWDIAGQERFTSMTRLYYRQAGACIIMFDVTNVTTFWNCLKWKHDLDGKVTLMDGSPVPCVLLANKSDLAEWAVTKEEIERFSKQNHFVGWIETSVKENKNINRAMSVLVDCLMSQLSLGSPTQNQGEYIQLVKEPASKTRTNAGCC